ncbi:phage tailspike polysaccharide lyase family protein [Pseudomonas putida]|uniref:phage tailspike polysaccharide lyase family protein n=1 Tax=Pseudomonas putida TaxID=303 RepID=UPI001179CDB7|nr:hypothetical protein [Pseudomonas putida]
MRYNTDNPVGTDGSSDPRDLYDNAGIIDLLLTGPLGEYLNRLGVPLKSWVGIMQQVTDYLIDQGYESVYLTYGAGVIVERQTQLVQRDGELYRVMNASDIPLTLTGTWATDAPKLQAVGDAALRQALANGSGDLVGLEGGVTLEEWSRHVKLPSQFASLKEWAASGGSLGLIGSETYLGVEQVDFADGSVIHTYGAATLDFSAVTSAAAFPDLTCVRFGDLSRTLLPKLTSAAKGDLTLGFEDAHGLAAGDTFAIWNPTDSSFAPGHRTAYHEGEFCRVARVTSTTQVVLQSPLASSYVVANVDVYKTPPRSVTIKGSLKVRGSDTLTSLRAVRAMQLMDCDISGLRAISPIGPSAFEMRQCFKVSGKGVSAEQWALSGTGTDYGIIHSGCQDIQIEGFFAASRHAITTGGYGQVCDVVNRNIQMKGTASTTFQGGVPAVNTHGNTEHFSFEGFSYGGVYLGGNFSRVRGTIKGGPSGICVEFTELSGHDHDLATCLLDTIGNPGAVARGVIDLGGNTEPSLAGTAGGTLNFRGVRIIAPNSSRGLVLRQRVSTALDIKIDVRDVAIEKLAGSSISLLVDAPSGSAFATLSRHGFVDNTAATQSVSNVTEIKGAELADNKVFNITAGASSPLTVPVNYPAGMFGSIAPVVSCSISSAVNGTKGLCYAAANQTSAGFTATIATADGSPFASSASVTFGYECKSKK